MFRSLKQCVKQYCPPQEEQQGDMLLFINSYALNPHRRGRAALFLSLREEVGLNSLRYMWHLALCHSGMFVGVCLCVCTHIETEYTLIRVARVLLKSPNFDPWALRELSSSISNKMTQLCAAKVCFYGGGSVGIMIFRMSPPIFVSFSPMALHNPSYTLPTSVYSKL